MLVKYLLLGCMHALFGLQAREANDVEPVFYHSLPIEFDEEMIYSFDIVSIIELAAGQGNAALTAALQKKPYFGITLTDAHTSGLKDWLASRIWRQFLTEGSPVFQSDLAAIMQEEEDAAASQTGGSAKAAAKPKAAPPSAVSQSSGSGTKRKAATEASAKPKPKAKGLRKDALLKKIKALSSEGHDDGDEGDDDEESGESEAQEAGDEA